ncbi:MAG: hypothetical protein JO110_00360, partial [Acetobacteraceae bacterium]|nr:hypothetical protein [Acetobacteraceae bacterium]
MPALPRLEDIYKIDFSSAGNSGRFVRTGWGVAESGFRWMTGRESRLGLQIPDPESDYMLLLDATPFLSEAALTQQHLTVIANGYELTACTPTGRRVLPVFMPKDVLAGERDVELVFKHPNAQRIG